MESYLSNLRHEVPPGHFFGELKGDSLEHALTHEEKVSIEEEGIFDQQRKLVKGRKKYIVGDYGTLVYYQEEGEFKENKLENGEKTWKDEIQTKKYENGKFNKKGGLEEGIRRLFTERMRTPSNPNDHILHMKNTEVTCEEDGDYDEEGRLKKGTKTHYHYRDVEKQPYGGLYGHYYELERKIEENGEEFDENGIMTKGIKKYYHKRHSVEYLREDGRFDENGNLVEGIKTYYEEDREVKEEEGRFDENGNLADGKSTDYSYGTNIGIITIRERKGLFEGQQFMGDKEEFYVKAENPDDNESNSLQERQHLVTERKEEQELLLSSQ